MAAKVSTHLAGRVAAAGSTCRRPGGIAPSRRSAQWQQRRAALRPSAARRVAAAAEAEEEEAEGLVSGAFCMPAFVTADNKRSQCFTILDVEVGDYPGLLRVLCWTLNGLDVVAQNAVVRTSKDGQAHNTFWLTNRSGEKLEDSVADQLAERVRDFVMYCSPDEGARERTEFCAGPIMISNSLHSEYTVIMVQEPRPTPGFLLEVASALSGMNVQILQGLVQGGSGDEDTGSSLTSADSALLEKRLDDGSLRLNSDSTGRVFKFFIANGQGQKLDYGGISALLYTLTSVLGYRTHPTVPPEQEMLMEF